MLAKALLLRLTIILSLNGSLNNTILWNACQGPTAASDNYSVPQRVTAPDRFQKLV